MGIIRAVITLFLLLSIKPGLAQQACPVNSTVDPFSDECVCNTGYEERDNGCSKIEIPQNATLTKYNGWVCDPGYRKNKNSCEKVVIPLHESAPIAGARDCDIGQKIEGNICIQVPLPQNAHFTFADRWECNTGYIKEDEQCREMDRDELVSHLNLLNDMLTEQLSSPPTTGNCSVGFKQCEKECEKQFISYFDEEKCVAACRTGRSACR